MKAAFLLPAIFLLLLASACKKHGCDSRFQSTGQVRDGVLCNSACCGGYIITIDGTQYRFYKFPAGMFTDLQEKDLPLNVSLNWHPDTSAGCPALLKNFIVIDDIEKN